MLSHLNSITSALQNPRFQQELKSTAVFPQITFPVRSHENILTSLVRRKLLPEDEEWENQGREIAQGVKNFDPERENEFIEWCQTRFMGFTEGREYSKGIESKEEKGAKMEMDQDNENENADHDGGVESKSEGVALGAALKYMAQGWEPTKPPQPVSLRQAR
jgi:mediator of RNA polymerase II transcription subunit 8, fungi type